MHIPLLVTLVMMPETHVEDWDARLGMGELERGK
jgi:hypothetical protein